MSGKPQTRMPCPFCGHHGSVVTKIEDHSGALKRFKETRLKSRTCGEPHVLRFRNCNGCDKRFITVETDLNFLEALLGGTFTDVNR